MECLHYFGEDMIIKMLSKMPMVRYEAAAKNIAMNSVLKSGLYVTTDLHCRCVGCDHVQFISAGVLIHLLSDLSFYIRQYLSE